MNKLREWNNQSKSQPKVIYLSGVALGIIMTNWFDRESGSTRWFILILGIVFVLIGILGIEEKK